MICLLKIGIFLLENRSITDDGFCIRGRQAEQTAVIQKENGKCANAHSVAEVINWMILEFEIQSFLLNESRGFRY